MSTSNDPRSTPWANGGLARAVARIDALNGEDPRGGPEGPLDLVYGRRMSDWLHRLAPDASDALRVAVRAQHVARHRLPRSSYPDGRAGYLAWRTELGRRHAETASRIVAEEGADPAFARRVGDLVRKRDFLRDPDAQTVEDCACLVFLEHELAAFAATHDEAQVIEILRKTWRKMSPVAREAARALALDERAAALVRAALGG